MPIQYLLEIINDTYTTHYALKSSERGELLFSSLVQSVKEYPVLSRSIPNKELQAAALPFAVEMLRAFSLWKEADYTSGAVLCHITYCFKESTRALSQNMEEAIPAQPMAQRFQEHLRSRASHLAPYEGPLYHLVWNLFLTKTPHRPTTFKSKEELQGFLLRISDIVFVILTFLQERFRAYFDFISTAPDSALWKQYQKQTLPFLRDPSQWVIMFCRDMILHPEYLIPFVQIYYYQTFFPTEPFYSFVERLLSSKKREMIPSPLEPSMAPRPGTPGCVSEKEGIHLVAKLSAAMEHAMIFMSKSSMDIYFLLRMLKSPGKGIYTEEGVRPAMVFAYLGHAHSRHIRSLLLSPLFEYQDRQTISAHDLHSVSRCISLPEPINLRDELERHVASLSGWPTQRNQYQRRVTEENQRRGVIRKRKTRRNRRNVNKD